MDGSQFKALVVMVPALLTGCASHMAAREQVAPAPMEAVVSAPAPKPVVTTSVKPEEMYQVLVAEVAMQRGQYDVAIKNYLDLGRSTRDVRMAERAARVAVYAHDNEHALEAAKLWVELDSSNLEARQVLTALFIRNGQLEEAQRQLEEVLAMSSTDAENGFMLIAGLLGRQQDKQAALQVMERLIAARPDDPAALLAFSHLAVRTGALDLAEDAIKRVVQLQPGRVEPLVQQARILTMRGKAAEALGLMEVAVKDHPKEMDLRTAYARLLVDAKQFEKALAQFKIVNKQTPNQPDILFALGMVAVQLERVDEGERYLIQLNRANKGYVAESAYYLGRLAEEYHKDPDAAIKWYSKVDRGENALEAQVRIAALMAQKGEVNMARAHLRTITPRGPAQALRLFLVEGQILRDAGRNQEAMEVFNAGLEELPDNSDLLYSRAMVAEKLNQLDLMEDDLKRILAREPDNADALNALGYTLADRTRRYDDALGYIQRAMELRPDSHYVLDSMGWLQYRLGNYQEAVSYLRRALEASPDSEIAAHLTEVLWVMGDKQAARTVWKQALDASPGDKFLLEVMDKLDHQ